MGLISFKVHLLVKVQSKQYLNVSDSITKKTKTIKMYYHTVGDVKNGHEEEEYSGWGPHLQRPPIKDRVLDKTHGGVKLMKA